MFNRHLQQGVGQKLMLVVALPILLLLLLFASASGAEESSAAASPAAQPDPSGLQRLVEATNGRAVLSQNPATGVVGFLRIADGAGLSLAPGQAAPAQADAFFAQYGGIFGIADPSAELVQTAATTDSLGMQTVTYQQVYQGVPVFAAILRVHLNAANELSAANGVFVPRIDVNPVPSIAADAAAVRAVAATVAEHSIDGAVVDAASLSVAATTLYVYRDGLIQGVPGPNYLVYEVEVTNGTSLRDFVYVDAHSGKIVNHISAVEDALHRVIYELSAATPPIWEEGDLFPGALNLDQQNIVNFSGDSYHFFNNAFGRDSYDGLGAFMRSVNNDPTISCPNANWNGATTNYCNGVTSDDVVAHEWGHAYTQFTSDLIYQWQPGALNESYSDIWGETVDMLNGAQTDAPAPVRTVNSCSTHTSPLPVLIVNSPASIAGDYPAAGASFGPPLTAVGVTGNVVAGLDPGPLTTDACSPLTNAAAVAGNIALVDRGTCGFAVKVKNAQNAGAIGVIVANNVPGAPAPMGGVDPTITIPSVLIAQTTANDIKAELASGVNATMRIGSSGTPENSYRWLVAEDSSAFGGAIRDMWTPTCRADAGKVSDAEYHCATTDAGGVHSNSGVPNHGYALLVDGGTYNGQTVTGIGLTKAAHIYWRAQAVYQTPTTKFADHADALEAACSDLIGQNLEGLSTTATPAGPSGQSITAADCGEVSDMIAAVELRTEPTQCNFQPLLAQNPPALCSSGVARTIYIDDFESGLGDWTLTNQGVFANGWPNLDWAQDTSLPGGRAGAAAFAVDPLGGTCAGPTGGDISGVMHMTSASITIPGTTTAPPRLAFDHYVATEAGWDGGNLKMSVNGGAFSQVPAAAFTFNPYNATLQTAPAGNTNPLAGQAAFTGTDGGELGGSWGQSQVNLGAAGAAPGNTVSLRYDFGMDGCNGLDGWYVDDVNVYSCEANAAPSCGGAVASKTRLWPANHKFNAITVLGVTDAEDDPVTITIDSIHQDEAVNANGSGNTAPDGQGVGTSTAEVRAERVNNGNGRVYYIGFTAEDLYGATCSGVVQVGVPKNANSTAVGDGPNYDSTVIP